MSQGCNFGSSLSWLLNLSLTLEILLIMAEKKPVNVNPGKTELILPNCLYSSGAINVNMDAFFFAKKYFSK